jgi:hypothetical protein
VIKNGRPVPVAVQKMATDGALTAVSSEDLQEGMQVIVNAIAAG